MGIARTGWACALALALSACGGEAATPTSAPTLVPSTAEPTVTASASSTSGPTAVSATPVPSPTPERVVVYLGELKSKVTNEEQTASGTFRIVFDLQRSGTQITGATAQFSFSINGLPADARVQFSHIHLGPAGVEGPILLDSGQTAARFRFTNGEGSLSLDPVQCDPKLAAEILANPSGYHFMVHSARNPDGFIRGQLRRG